MGGGAGWHLLREKSDFAEESDDVSDGFAGYHALGGVEFRRGRLATAVEAQYTIVPDALNGGVAELFGEDNLGGFQIRLKLLF